MAPAAPHEQLRRARAQRGEDLAALASRTGLRPQHARAIEEGRYGDLPPGIYGRAAIRSFAAAYALDAEAVLADCEPLLPRIENPIDALARRRGVVTVSAAAPPASGASRQPAWQPFAAASLDGAVNGALLLLVSGGAAILARVSVATLHRASAPLLLVGLVLGLGYYVWLGGLSGTTLGEYAVGPEPRRRDPRPLTLRAIFLRTLAAATADARAIHRAGAWVGRSFTSAGVAGTDRLPATSPSPPPPRDREERLTWSTSRRASVPPPPLRPRRG
ncbi:MAG TPA: helix-turn-helix transcriptional regulator [Vicinamibacterales bacterium]|jgi:transcriptional regulator with XRE-family HTH domain